MNYLDILRPQFTSRIELRTKRPGIDQLIAPLYHEDGDMMDIYLEEKKNNNTIRISDYGMTLMRLSYSFELDTPNKERIFRKILEENQVNEYNGTLYIDSKPESLYPAIMQLAQVIAKVSNMRHYKREVIQSLFYEILDEIVETQLQKYNPKPNFLPLPSRDDLEVDYLFNIKPSPIFLFGVKDTSKARLTTICILQFRLEKLKFKGFVVHEDFESLTRKDRVRITSSADKQFPSLDDFRENANEFFDREVA